jgi:subfamily B ATP-binding cassette protein HlyB/CyaB
LSTDDAEGGDVSAFACLSLLLGFLQLPVDATQLQHQLGGRAPTSADLVRLARRAGARAKIARLRLATLEDAPLPAIGCARNGTYFILAAAEDDRVLVQKPGLAPEQLTADDLFRDWDGEAVLVTSRTGVGGITKFDVTWFIPALMRYRVLLGDVLASSLFLQLFALVTPIFFQVVIDKVLVHRGLTTLDVLATGFAGLVLFEALLGGLRSWVFVHTTSRVDVELGAKLYRHLLALPLAYFETRRVGDSVARVRELETIREFLTSSAATLVIDLLFTAIFLVVMWFYSPLLLLVVAASLVFYLAISVVITPPLRARIEERFKRGAESQAFLVESVAGVQTIKAAAVEPQMHQRWETLLAGYVSAAFRAAALGIWGGQAIQLVNKIAVVAILYIGARLVIAGDLTVGELVAFNMLAGRVAEPVLRLAQLWQQFQEARVGVARLGDIFNTPTEAVHAPSRSSLPQIRGRIAFEDVTFRYRPDAPEVLRRVSLHIEPGEVVGVVGPSGSGKSTLTKLVQRLYVPDSGRVLVDGVDLALVDPAWLRRQVGVVLQENRLFNRSVRENIALSDPGMDLQRVMAAADLAGAHDFILGLRHGYDTEIEEQGANLSGGQRQRIAIARALVTNPRILIFDEATSALDAESEAIVQKNLRRMAQGRTVIIIAHRLSAIRDTGRIVTIENGTITEIGAHAELIARGGRYAGMWKSQTEGFLT